MATGKKKLTVLCLRAFLFSTNIDVFHVFSRSFVGCCRVCVVWQCCRAAHFWERNKTIQSLEVEGWVTKTTQVYKFTAKTSRQNWNKFYLLSDQPEISWHEAFCHHVACGQVALEKQSPHRIGWQKVFRRHSEDLRKPKQLRAPSTCSRCFQPNWKVLANWANYQLIFPNNNRNLINIFETTHFNLSLCNNWWHDDPKGPNKSQRLNLGCGDGGSKGVVCWSSISRRFCLERKLLGQDAIPGFICWFFCHGKQDHA